MFSLFNFSFIFPGAGGQLTHLPLYADAHEHLDRLNHFCKAHGRDNTQPGWLRDTQTHHATPSAAIARIYALCMRYRSIIFTD